MGGGRLRVQGQMIQRMDHGDPHQDAHDGHGGELPAGQVMLVGHDA